MGQPKIIWTYPNQMKFINLLRERSILWNPNDPNFTNSFQRELAYGEIAFELNLTNDETKKKIHTLRGQFLKEHRRLERDKNYQPKWQYYDELTFLYVRPLRSEGALQKPTQACEIVKANPSKSHNLENEDEMMDGIDDDDDLDRILESSVSTSQDDFKEQQPKPKRRRLASNVPSQENTIRADYTEIKQPQDEFTLFGENIAMELRMLEKHKAIQLAFKEKLLQALLEADQTARKLHLIKDVSA